MCGIIGYIGKDKKAIEKTISCLEKLEYRGYDSAGIAVYNGSDIIIEKSVGRLDSLKEKLKGKMPNGTVGIGHTRWATHGRPSDVNAHPHTDCHGDFVVVHNGIIENYMTLKEELLKKVLIDDGIEDVQIRSIVVFTDNRIEVQNKYSRIRTCFVSQLAYIIDGFKSSTSLSEEEMEHIEGLIKEAECKEAYPFDFDVAQYKIDFATLMAVLEEASAQAEEQEYEQEVVSEKKNVWTVLKKAFTSRYAGYAGSAAAAAAVTFISTVAVSAIRKGGVIR